jgi:hypothetical protein
MLDGVARRFPPAPCITHHYGNPPPDCAAADLTPTSGKPTGHPLGEKAALCELCVADPSGCLARPGLVAIGSP